MLRYCHTYLHIATRPFTIKTNIYQPGMMPRAHSSGIWVWQHQHPPRGFPDMNTNKYNHVDENCVSSKKLF